nr:DUF4282 domain-containing protein [Isachenkonia alkalipeptolytica]
MKAFLSFDKLIVPSFIKVIFYLEVTIFLLIGSGMASTFGGGFQVFLGLMVLFFGPLFSRVSCELTIILFKIHDQLKIGNERQKDIL